MTTTSGVLAATAAIQGRAEDFKTRPRLWPAIRMLAGRSLDQYQATTMAMRHVVKDRGSYLLMLAILYAWQTEPHAATQANFKNRVASLGISSKGRAADLIQYMCDQSLLLPGETPGTWRPGKELLLHNESGIRLGAEVLAELAPEARFNMDVDEALARAYILVSARVAAEVFAAFGTEPPALSLFGERKAGMLTAFALLGAMEGGRPEGEARISIAGLSSRLDVSRPHILKLLEDGAAGGFLVWRQDSHTVSFTEAFIRQMEHFFAGFLALHEAYLNQSYRRA